MSNSPSRDGCVEPASGPFPSFRRAAFLPELRRARRERPFPAPPASVEQTIEDWREAAQLTSPEFDELLAAEGLGRADLAHLLSQRELDDEAPPPAWQATLQAVLRCIAGGAAAASLAPAAAGGPPFATVLDGFVAVAWEDLRARAPRPTGLDLEWTALAPKLQAQLRTLLLQICQRTLVLELNVARLEGWLDGDTPAARYASYVRALREQPGLWLRLLDEYQVMARLLCTTIESWVAGLVELLEHLAADLPRLVDAALLPGAHRLCLVELAGGLSDPHRGGRGVWKLSFRAEVPGELAPPLHRLVYKPRSLAVDVCFQALLEFCNRGARLGALGLAELEHARLASPPRAFPELRLLRLLDRGDHGWVELVPRLDCDDAAAAARFYLRQGAYLALLHVLDGADLHYENVIASGEHPMLVDLETLFHPWLPVKATAAPSSEADATTLAAVVVRDSVMRSALLPGRAWGDRERAGVNIGGLGDGRTQLSPREALDWEEPGTDVMHATGRRLELPPGDNLPRVGGEVVPVSHHVEELVAGFEAMMRFLRAERDTLLGPGGAIRAFADVPVRRLLRGTSAYAHLLEASRHPDHLRDAVDREALFDLLWKVSQGQPRLLRVVAREKEDLRHGDVPYFSARPSSRDLWDSRGERIADFFPAPAFDGVAAQLSSRGSRELAEQVFILRASVSAASVGIAASPQRSASPLAARGPTALDAAAAIGELLEATAIRSSRDATWLGMVTSRDGAGVDLGPLRGGLYDGTGGIALFLGHLGHQAGEPRFTRLAELAARATRRALDGETEPGGFAGALSELYALSHLAALWGDRSLIPPLGPIFDRVTAQLASEPRFDVIYGAAGSALAALAIHELTGDERALAVAAAAGRALIAGARRGEGGASWPCAVSERHLLGFSHGAAGVGAALLRLSRAAAGHTELGLDAAELAALAEAAFDFERGHFHAPSGNWPDLREEAGGTASAPKLVLAYCHGAPGIALSRLAALPLDPGAAARRDLEIAIETTLAGRVQDGQTLCHGELGNLMIVRRAAALLGRDDWQAQVDRRLDVTLARLLERGPSCSFDFPRSAPALMDGIAGIGYGLLALTHLDALPFVLDLS